ncbi:MAG: alkaline phosphatase [Pseudomonadota bacterium]
MIHLPRTAHRPLHLNNATRRLRGLAFALASVVAVACAAEPVVETPARALSELDPEFWRAKGADALETALANAPITGATKGIILFVGDGMGVTTITSGRWLAGELAQTGNSEGHTLHFEDFPNVSLIKTYNVDAQTPDSAGTMSAMMTGVKTDAGVLSVAAGVERGDCASAAGQRVETLLEQLEARGWATGVVTTTTLTHATPAAAYAHSADRGWENDSRIPRNQRGLGCRDIARQLIEFEIGDGLEVAMGGGRASFLPNDVADPEFPDRTGQRLDGRHLADEWSRREGAEWVWNLQQMLAVDDAKTRHLLGLFNPGHMQYELDRPRDAASEPSLAQMTRKALEILQRDEDGYLLIVEGGRIDHAHHATNAKRALRDTVALADAVQVADEMTKDDDTLIVVTADHSHVFSVAGYSSRGNPVLGVVAIDGQPVLAADGKPYTTLGYANGRGGRLLEPSVDEVGTPAIYGEEISEQRRIDHDHVDTTADGFYQESLVPKGSETHGGEDVALFAKGPWAHLFTGTAEQSYIYYVMAHAAAAGN